VFVELFSDTTANAEVMSNDGWMVNVETKMTGKEENVL
jgi:hypothetical protein